MKYFSVSRLVRLGFAGLIGYRAIADAQYLLLIPTGLLLLLALFNPGCGTGCNTCNTGSCNTKP